jgi:hypothetical protein
MDFSTAGLIGSVLAILVGMTSYFLTVPAIQKRLREIGPKDTPEQRADMESKLGIMRRLILTMDVVVFGLVGYWLGKTVAG